MKIYFAGSIRGGREDVKLYKELINHLGNFGTVLTEHIADDKLDSTGEKDLSDREIHDRDLDWLKQSDVLVAEVTAPSLGVGYEIKTAIAWNKKVLCLFREQGGKKLSAMISGCPDIEVNSYTDVSEAKEILNQYFNSILHTVK